jgi:hypothetical protein
VLKGRRFYDIGMIQKQLQAPFAKFKMQMLPTVVYCWTGYKLQGNYFKMESME